MHACVQEAAACSVIYDQAACEARLVSADAPGLSKYADGAQLLADARKRGPARLPSKPSGGHRHA